MRARTELPGIDAPCTLRVAAELGLECGFESGQRARIAPDEERVTHARRRLVGREHRKARPPQRRREQPSCAQGHSAPFGASCRRGGGPSDLTSNELAMSSTI